MKKENKCPYCNFKAKTNIDDDVENAFDLPHGKKIKAKEGFYDDNGNYEFDSLNDACIAFNGDKYYLAYVDDDDWTILFSIKNCPMCGRRL